MYLHIPFIVLPCTFLYHHVPSCTTLYCAGTRQYILVCTGMYCHRNYLCRYVLVCTILRFLVRRAIITRQESYRKCYITSFNLLLQKRTSERFHGKEGFYTASLHFPLFQTAPFRIATLGAICSEAIVWPYLPPPPPSREEVCLLHTRAKH